MKQFFQRIWRSITFIARILWWIILLPFRILWWLIRLPFYIIRWLFQAPRAAIKFMNTEPEEKPIGDVFVDLVQNENSRDMFWEHVEVFRMHLLRATIGLAVGVGLMLFFARNMIAFLAIPVGGLDALRAIEVTESISVFMKVSLLAGLAVSLPYIAFELWLFAAPGLRPRERWVGLLGIPMATIFFAGGIVFTYYILLPSALPFLLDFLGIKAQLRPDAYFSFVTDLMFWIGLSFEFPLVIYVLTAVGLIKPQPLAANWRVAIVVIAIIAAAITPTVDPVNMSLVMLPMILLYFISIGLSYIAYAGRGGKSAEKNPVGEQSA